jgi:ATP-dependent helicase HrpA
MTFRAVDHQGDVLGQDADLDRLRAALRPRLRAALAEATLGLERHGLHTWTIGTLPRSVALAGTDGAVRAYPALVDEGDAVGVLAFETEAAQGTAMHAGTRRLLRLNLPSPARAAERSLTGPETLTLAAAPHPSLAAVLEDATVAALDRLIASAGGPAWTESEFAALRDRVGAGLAAATAEVLRGIVAIVAARAEVHRRLAALPPDPGLEPARLDLATQLGSLVYPGFAAATGADRLPDVARYLAAAARRAERLPGTRAQDADRMRVVHELELDHRRRLAARPDSPALHEVSWMLQELRVSSFAQGVGVRGQVSAKRIRRALETAAADDDDDDVRPR